MPDLALDFSWVHPPVDDLVNVGCKAILVYVSPNPQGAFNTPPIDYLHDCVNRGIGVCPIFEQNGEQPNEGYDRGRLDGDRAVGWMDRVGVPDGVRLWVNMADTPGPSPVDAIRDYARGFAETFPTRWRLGSYGNLGALRASQVGSQRFTSLWAVETWGPPPNTTVDQHWTFFLNESDVVLVQMANIPAPLEGTDTNWLVPGMDLGAWGLDSRQEPEEMEGVRYPLDGEVRINSGWGPRDGGFHYGVDLWAPNGTPVYACADGYVFYAAFEADGGNHLAQYLDRPPVPAAQKAGYMHLQEFIAQPGEHVTAGQLIALSDNTGGSSGPHLHFWMGNNANVGAIDPTPFILAGLKPKTPTSKVDQLAEVAMRGDNAVCMVQYGQYELTFHVNAMGELVHNSVGPYGVPAVIDEVLLEGNDPNVQPSARVANDVVIVATVNVQNGRVHRIAYVGSQGKWVDTSNGNKDLMGVHPI